MKTILLFFDNTVIFHLVSILIIGFPKESHQHTHTRKAESHLKNASST